MRVKRLVTAVTLCLILLAGCAAEPYQPEEQWVLEEQKAVTFSDGESADLWRLGHSGHAFYKLSDGTSLLTVQAPSGPGNVFVGGTEGYGALSETAQKAVSAYYDKQGLLYDTRSELNKAYADYLACKENGTEYHNRHISQDISPTANSARIMCFLTSVMLPVSAQEAQELRLGAVFDRETGEVMRIWDLFTIPEAEARQTLIDAFDFAEPEVRAEMAAALKPEYIILFPEMMEVTFPMGTLPSQQHRYGTGIPYKKLKSVLQPWAIPDNET